MTKLTIVWIFIMSFIATMVIFLFGGQIFQACYSPEVTTMSLQIAHLSPLTNCLIYTGILVFLIMSVCPIVLTVCIYTIYVLIFNRSMSYAIYFLWIFWCIFLYFITFQLNLVPII